MKTTSRNLAALAMLAGALTPMLLAAEPNKNSDREELVVTGTRTNYQVATPALLDVIGAEEIRRSAASSVVDVLRNRGSVRITDLFGDGSRATISVRGFGDNAGSHALVLVNGRRLNNNDLASADLNSIALKDVERIEILEGSASTLYGDQAVAGVINIITNSAHQANHYVRVGGGSYNSANVELGATADLGDYWAASVRLQRRESDNYRDHNEATYSNATIGLERNGERHRQWLDLQYVDDYLETPGALFEEEVAANRRQSTANYRDDFLDTQTLSLRLGFAGPLSDHWDYELDISGRESDGEFLQSFSFAKETQVATQDRRLITLNPRLIGYLPTLAGDALVVVGIDWEDIEYDLLTRFGPQNSEQTISSVYGRVVQPLSNEVEMTYGLRFARSENELRDGFKFATPTQANDSVWGGELGFRFDVGRSSEAYWRVERIYRFGKVDEHTTFATTTPLEPSTGFSYEIGIEHTTARAQWRAALWQLDLENEIAFDPAVFDNVNLDPTRRIGLTLFAAYDVSAATQLSLSGSLLDAEVRSGTYQGKDVPMVADYNLRAALNQRLCETLTALLEWQRVGDRVSSGDFNNSFGRLAAYDVLNVAFVWSPSQHELSLRVNNVLNEKYSEFGAIGSRPTTFIQDEAFQPSPEINANLSWRYSF